MSLITRFLILLAVLMGVQSVSVSSYAETEDIPEFFVPPPPFTEGIFPVPTVMPTWM